MIDVQLLREAPEAIQKSLANKGYKLDIETFKRLDDQRRGLIQQVEELKALRNRVSAEIPQLKRQGEDVTATLEKMREVGDQIKSLDAELASVSDERERFLASIPNLPDEDLAPGGKENNEVIAVYGTAPHFDFEPLHHVDLAERLHLIDYTRGAKLAGSGHWVYTGDGARLEWALLNYFVDTHLRDGYQMILPPHLLNYRSGYTAGQFPKFEDDVFWLEASETGEGRDRQSFLLPTAETALVNLYRDEILDESELPKKFFAFTPCYRREAGSYRADERGMIRGHQFNKIELFQYCRPEDSDAAFEELVNKAASLVEGLGLHFQLVKLAAEDCSASMARTSDIEIFIPSMGGFKEVSSASNARAYQARRGNMKFRRAESGKTEYLHTLNASGLATSRVFPALLEQCQEADGRVRIPEVLRPYMGGQTHLA
ncbi:MAG: serine--tRNA ligase [Eubacteriales bacterium]|nr:serine--tRNA ligase [Eubacteriales bacterium]